jgi:hypothetical protein
MERGWGVKLTKTKPVLCIDPGTTHSGLVVFDGLKILYINAEYKNEELIEHLGSVGTRGLCYHLVIEGIASYGMAVGQTTFETCEWIGRFRQAYGYENTTKIYRKDVKMFLCNSMRAKDANIRRRVLDIFPATGGGKTPQIGTKSKPGPLYGVTSHAISALALGLTFKYCKS